MVKAVYRVLIPNCNHNYARSYPLQLLPGPIRSPVACRVDANVDAMEHRILEVLCIVSEHNDVLRTNGGCYTCYTQQVLKDLIVVP